LKTRDEGQRSLCPHLPQVSAYHDGALEPSAAQALHEHMTRCADCAGELARLRRLSGLLADVPVPAMRPGAMVRMHRAVAATRQRVVVMRLARVLSAAAATILVVCTAWLWVSAQSGQPESWGISSWEAVAVGSIDDTDAEALLAQWIVEDLSRENAHE